MKNKKGMTLVWSIVIAMLCALAVFTTYLVVINKNGKNTPSSEKITNSISDKEDDIQNSEDTDKNEQFLMSIEDVFDIEGVGVTICGRVIRGSAKVNDEIEVVGFMDENIKTQIERIEITKNISTNPEIIEPHTEYVSSIKKEQYAGVVLTNVKRENIERGQVLAFPGSIDAYNTFDATIEIEDVSNYEEGKQIDIYFTTTDVKGTILSIENKNNSNKDIKVKIKLDDKLAMEKGTEFKIRLEQKVIGNGIVTKLYE